MEGGAVYCREWVVQPRVVEAKTGELGGFLVFFFGWTGIIDEEVFFRDDMVRAHNMIRSFWLSLAFRKPALE